MTPRTYASPEAFKQALEQRLRRATKTGANFARKRQMLVFDRFLARIVAVLGDAVTLKGGLVLAVRIERVRATKDVDLRVVGFPDDILAGFETAHDVFPLQSHVCDSFTGFMQIGGQRAEVANASSPPPHASAA